MTANVLMLYCAAAKVIGTVADHLDAFSNMSTFKVVQIDSGVAGNVELEIDRFDAVVFHYSLVLESSNYINEHLREQIRRYKGAKVLFIQDEMRWVNRTVDAIVDLGIKTVFSVVNPEAQRKIYHDPRLADVRFETTLTGFVPEHLIPMKVPAYEDRKIDVGYRARKLSAWYGSFAREKWLISKRLEKDAKRFKLNCDLSNRENERLYGKAWIKFMANCRATLGVESGASFVDFTGAIYPQVEAYEAANPDATFEEIRDKFLEGRDGEIVIHVISPRCFEAAALRTLMIMYEGDYSGILEAGRHYVVLERDHSNMEEVASYLREPAKAKPIIDAAYEEIACSGKWTFKAFIGHFDQVLSEELEKIEGSEPARTNPFDATVLAKMGERFERLHRWRVRRQQTLFLTARAVLKTAIFIRNHMPEWTRPIITRYGERVIIFLKPHLRRLMGLG
jgi:SAM-dependent methyltransferase